MVSLSAIQTIAKQVAVLEEKRKPTRVFRAISVNCATFSDRDAVLARHYQLYPGDADPDVICASTIYPTCVDDIWGDDDRKRDVAWRQLAREELGGGDRAAVIRTWARRAIDNRLVNERYSDEHFNARSIGDTVERFAFPAEEAFEIMRAAGVDIEDAMILRGFAMGRQDAQALGRFFHA